MSLSSSNLSGSHDDPTNSPRFEEKALQVLLVEDNPGDARLFEEHLRESATEATLRHEETLQAGLGALEEERPDVLVADLGLPDSAGTETVEAAAATAPEVPIVVLTGRDDLQAALDAQEAGASEYLQKEELTPTLVGRTLRWAVQRHRMQAKLRERDAWIRSITEGLSAGVFRAGPTGRIEYANEALAEMLGFERAEKLIGLDLTSFCADPAGKVQMLMLAEDGASDMEVEFEARGGDEFVGLLTCGWRPTRAERRSTTTGP
jgi:PAS domain S-box